MKYFQLISLQFLLNSEVLLSGDNAYPLENGVRQMGVFQPSIFGMKNNLEVSTHPILFLIKPNFQVKKYHGELKGIGLASRYSFDYFTQLLKLIQREGEFGILSKDPDIGEIPNLFIIQWEWLVTKKLTDFSLTGKLGMSICPGCDLDKRHLVDLPLAYPRMAIYHYGIAANSGFDLNYNHSENISIKTDLDLLFLPEVDIFIKHKLLCNYQFSTKYTLSVGYILTHGNYPYGKQVDIFPLIDLSWKWKK